MEHPTIKGLDEAANDLISVRTLVPYLAIRADRAHSSGPMCVSQLPVGSHYSSEVPQDIFSYNVEQSKGARFSHTLQLWPCAAEPAAVFPGDTHNIVIVVQKQEGLGMQSAVDYVGALCVESMERFQSLRAVLPSWDPVIDKQVQIYVDGLGDWMIGNLVWSFETERYFGKSGRTVLEGLSVDVLPWCK